jgi:hypothetical protein
MRTNNNDVYDFFSKFMLIMFFFILLLALFLGVSEVEARSPKPLSKEENQRLIMIIGINGYKNSIKLNCYQSIIVKVRFDYWDDNYCAKSYGHLDFSEVQNG